MSEKAAALFFLEGHWNHYGALDKNRQSDFCVAAAVKSDMRNGHFFGQSHKHKKNSILRHQILFYGKLHHIAGDFTFRKNSKSAFSRWRHFLRKFTMFDTVFQVHIIAVVVE